MKEITQGKDRGRIWSLRYASQGIENDADIARLSAELHISPVTACLLCNRGYTTPEAACRSIACDTNAGYAQGSHAYFTGGGEPRKNCHLR